MALKHRKKRNAGLVYELLIRRMSSQVIGGDRQGLLRVFGIVKKHFSEGSPLSQEKELFDVIRSTRGATSAMANRVLSEVKRRAAAADLRVLEERKGDLIRDVNHTLGKGFYSEHRIPDYRLFASVQMIIDGARSAGSLTEDVDRIRLEEAVVKFMTTTDAQLPELLPEEKVDDVVLEIAVKKFEDAYGSSLCDPQKALLRRYIDSLSSGGDGLQKALVAEEARVSRRLDEALKTGEFSEDKVMVERLNEANKRLKTVSQMGDDERVQEVMLFQRLVYEMENE